MDRHADDRMWAPNAFDPPTVGDGHLVGLLCVGGEFEKLSARPRPLHLVLENLRLVGSGLHHTDLHAERPHFLRQCVGKCLD